MNVSRKTLNRILIAIAALWVVIVITATITAIVVRKSMNRESKKNEVAFPAMQNIKDKGEGGIAYTGVGSVRAFTAAGEGEEGVPVIVTAWFTYPKDDKVFFEEIATKSTLIRKTIESYFSTHTKEELKSFGEEEVKAQLQSAINSLLTLGQVGTFYFSEYLFLD